MNPIHEMYRYFLLYRGCVTNEHRSIQMPPTMYTMIYGLSFCPQSSYEVEYEIVGAQAPGVLTRFRITFDFTHGVVLDANWETDFR